MMELDDCERTEESNAPEIQNTLNAGTAVKDVGKCCIYSIISC